MLTSGPHLAVEITRIADDRLRVVFSRSDRAAQQVKEHPFEPEETERVASELAGRIAASAAAEAAENWESGFNRLAARLAGMILPGDVAGNLALGLPVEFVLDDYCMAFAVEALPGRNGPLGAEVAVVRRWLCDAFSHERKERGGGMEMLIVADPAGSHPAARREGQTVLRFMREANPDWRIRYLSRHVSRAALDDELPDTDVFHLAAHMEEDPPGIRMADGPWLPMPDRFAPGVVIAACCRAGGLGGAGRELAGRFLRAGSRQVIAPYAAVSDRLAEFFSRELYAHISGGASLAEAVRKARTALGPAGLVFIHYGTMAEQHYPSVRPVRETLHRRRKKVAAIAGAAFALAALLAFAFWLGGVIREGGDGVQPESGPGVAGNGLASSNGESNVEATGEVLPEASHPDKSAVREEAVTDRKAARSRVAEKMLNNF